MEIKNGLLNTYIEDSFVIIKIKPNIIPMSPNIEDKNISEYLHILINDWRSWYVNINEQIAVTETTITIIGDTIPALTAASPSTKAPRIESDVPLDEGVSESAS